MTSVNVSRPPSNSSRGSELSANVSWIFTGHCTEQSWGQTPPRENTPFFEVVPSRRTLEVTSRAPAAPAGPTISDRAAWENRVVARAGAFKDRPLWRRLQTIHHEIKERRFPNASTLAKALSVSTKTVQRDLDYLRDELEAPIEFRRQENGYVDSRSDYVLPVLPVDGTDLFAIGVAAQVLSLLGATPLARDLKSCYARLAELMPPAVRLRP